MFYSIKLSVCTAGMALVTYASIKMKPCLITTFNPFESGMYATISAVIRFKYILDEFYWTHIDFDTNRLYRSSFGISSNSRDKWLRLLLLL